MCILCVIQKWSRRIATMLPWLVIPLIALWLLSQFLPPAFRFEITSPRLACVFVLLVTLFWYEILMPQLSAWRVRRNARIRERKRSEAIELQKLRKTATRRCRNCLNAYRDQNPGGGKFMCSYCGHISKRPVLDLPIPPGLGGLSNSGILKDLVGKGGKMLNGKVWSDNGWICGQDWLENGGNWVGGTFPGGSDDDCFVEKSYSRFVVFICKCLATVFYGIMWLWRKVFRVSSSHDDSATDAEIRGLAKKGENGVNCNESKSEKARRKAEEKRQARLEKEQLEEEERKQREEVARLVEERRKLRDEITEAEKDRGKASPREKNNKKENEKKRQERKKEKDRGSSKSNSDVDELEKRAVKEVERTRHHKVGNDSLKHAPTHNNNIGSVGTRYLDRMRGSFLSSSRAFTGGGFFGKGANANTSNTREHKSGATLDHVQNTANRRDLSQSEHTPGKSIASTDDKNINRPVQVESQPPAPKKSWQQLFTRTSTVPPSSSSNVISRPKENSQKEVQSPVSSGYTATQGFDNPITFELPKTLPNFGYGDPVISTGLQLSSNSIFPRVGEAPDRFLPEESDIFEDPCYVPDPISLIGPVSESLDNFQSDLGFAPTIGYQKPHPVKRMCESSEVSRPSPIESPMSRFLPRAHEMNSLPVEDQGKTSDKGWQMWDSLGLAGDPSSWLLPPELNGLNKEGVTQPQQQKTMASLFKKDDQVPFNTQSSQEPSQNGRTYSRYVHATEDDPWMSRTLYGPMSGSDKQLPLNLQEHATQNELVYGNLNGSTANHPFPPSQGNFWAKRDRAVYPVSLEGKGSASTTRPVGGLYPTRDVQSLWSYE